MSHKPPEQFKKGYKYRIYPTPEQEKYLAQVFGCTRYLWNKVLGDTQQEYQDYLDAREHASDSESLQRPQVTGYSLLYRVRSEKSNPDTPWLKECPSIALQQKLLDLGQAYKRFFSKQARYPNYKKKDSRQSFLLPRTIGFKIKDGKLWLVKCPVLFKVIWDRELPSDPSSVTISKTPSGEYYASFLCEYKPNKTKGQGTVGIDVGLKSYATLSTGEKIDNPKWFKSSEKALKRAQQSLARKQLGSNKRAKAKLRVAKLHQRISNQRRDFQHKLARRLINENQVIGVENLFVSNMVRNRKLSKGISDAGWKSLINMLIHKANESQHAALVLMDPFYPSTHLCSNTGMKLDTKLKLSQRHWDCPYCDERHDRDVNAAINIRNEAVNAWMNSPDLSGQAVVLKYVR